jgi:hypothetical protein
VIVRLVHTSLGLSYLIAHVLPLSPSSPANSFVISSAAINNNEREREIESETLCV